MVTAKVKVEVKVITLALFALGMVQFPFLSKIVTSPVGWRGRKEGRRREGKGRTGKGGDYRIREGRRG